MKKVILAALVLSVSLSANAEYFFTANDALITPCIHTPISGKSALKSKLESAYGVKCSAEEDNEGTVIITCKARLTNMVFSTKAEATCNSLRKNVKTITGL